MSFQSDTTEVYINPFTLLETETSLKNSHDTAVGVDEVHYQNLKHLMRNLLLVMLNIFNDIWSNDSSLPTWNEATFIPIPTPGEDASIPKKNYHLVYLISMLHKERVNIDSKEKN